MTGAKLEAIPRLIALDWGTSSLRAYLLGDEGRVIDQVAHPWGIMSVPDGDFAKALAAAIGAWQSGDRRLPMLAAGMIGSAQGWREIPYCPCPAGLTELAAAVAGQAVALRAGADPAGALCIVPGIALSGDLPGVMRGEETQVVGALEKFPALNAGALLVLPGTHSKWVTVETGQVAGFSTYLTGELFALLGQHSILGRPAQLAQAADPAGSAAVRAAGAWAAFDQGVLTVRRHGSAGLSPLLFSTRTLVLTGRLAAEVSLDYLSGLLIGEELRCALGESSGRAALPMVLIGDPLLCERYHRALALFDRPQVPSIDNAAPAGLWRIAARTVLR
jgi:2-dehydro-3-deoxygalactonokinase